MSVRPRLTLVGAGPGDPGLLTIKGAKALRDADVILYDALANEELLEHARPGALLIDVGKRGCSGSLESPKPASTTQEEINRMIVAYAYSFGHVVRLKGGDPFVFGRGMEEITFAREHGLESEYIPGVSSAISVPGMAGIPVTHRGSSRSFLVITATSADKQLAPELECAARSGATVVVLMGLGRLEEIAGIYRRCGKGQLPAAVISNGSLPTMRSAVGTVESIAEKTRLARLAAPAVIVLGEVARFAMAGETVESSFSIDTSSDTPSGPPSRGTKGDDQPDRSHKLNYYSKPVA